MGISLLNLREKAILFNIKIHVNWQNKQSWLKLYCNSILIKKAHSPLHSQLEKCVLRLLITWYAESGTIYPVTYDPGRLISGFHWSRDFLGVQKLQKIITNENTLKKNPWKIHEQKQFLFGCAKQCSLIQCNVYVSVIVCKQNNVLFFSEERSMEHACDQLLYAHETK